MHSSSDCLVKSNLVTILNVSEPSVLYFSLLSTRNLHARVRVCDARGEFYIDVVYIVYSSVYSVW